ILVAVVAWTLRSVGRSDRLDAWWLYSRFTARERLQPHLAPDPDIVLVGIDDRCLDRWPEPTVAWGPHIADALDRLQLSGGRVVALDWIQAAPTEKYFKGNDERLQQALNRQPNIVLVELIRPEGSPVKVVRPWDMLLYAIPGAGEHGAESNLGYAEF